MSENFPKRSETLQRLSLVDPIEHSELLNKTAAEVPREQVVSPEIKHIVNEMLRLATVKDEEGGAQMVGLAASQVGVSKRIAIIDVNAGGVERQAQEMQVLINPRVIERSHELVDGREGCWSCDDFCANVPRSAWVDIEALDREGSEVQLKFEGFTARIVQHEVDHLDGIRCIDRVPENESWRLHLVDKSNKEEFDRYRKEWASWTKTFPREAWEKFRDGHK